MYPGFLFRLYCGLATSATQFSSQEKMVMEKLTTGGVSNVQIPRPYHWLNTNEFLDVFFEVYVPLNPSSLRLRLPSTFRDIGSNKKAASKLHCKDSALDRVWSWVIWKSAGDIDGRHFGKNRSTS
jgi:hypothetical protein